MFYFDTSALAKRYLFESGTDSVNTIFSQEGVVRYISHVSKIELYHGIFRKMRAGELPRLMLKKILKQFQRDLKEFHIMPLNDQVIKISQKIVSRHLLKTLDAIHVATAMIIKKTGSVPVHFVSSDAQQNTIALKHGLRVINPAAPMGK